MIERVENATYNQSMHNPNSPQTIKRIAALTLLLSMSLPLAAQVINPETPSSATIVVNVRDMHDAPVAQAEATLLDAKEVEIGKGATNTKGIYNFVGLPPGTYRVRINVEGLLPVLSPEVALTVEEIREISMIALENATSSTTIEVLSNLDQVAEAQVAQQEKQRVAGFLPNYYVSYIWDAAAMPVKLKYKLALRSVIDPATFIVVGGIAGVEQAHKTFPGYKQGTEGYAKRFGSAYADTIGSVLIGRAILPALFHQDPRYFYRGSGTARSRLWYAISSSIITRGDNGRPQPNYSGVLGSFAAAGLSNVYRASGDRDPNLTFRNGLIVMGSSAIVNVLREFLSRKMSSNVPVYANGKQ